MDDIIVKTNGERWYRITLLVWIVLCLCFVACMRTFFLVFWLKHGVNELKYEEEYCLTLIYVKGLGCVLGPQPVLENTSPSESLKLYKLVSPAFLMNVPRVRALDSSDTIA